jgi:SpoVK/Ycf46/Vps4 family AAA+-type ATPase
METQVFRQALPEWELAFERIYRTKIICQFILHGNIFDFVRYQKEDGSDGYYKFKGYLTDKLFKQRDLVLTYNRSEGIGFRDDGRTEADFQSFLSRNQAQLGKANLKDPVVALNVLNYFVVPRLEAGRSVAIVIDYAETIVPVTTTSLSSTQDRDVLVTLLRWASELNFHKYDMTIVLLTGQLTELHPQLTRNPYTAEIEIPYPTEADRLHFIRLFLQHVPDRDQRLEMSTEVLARQTAGLNLVMLRTLLAEIIRDTERFTFAKLKERKKALIETEAGGLLEFIETRFNLDQVAGHARAKEHLRAAAQALKNGRGDVLPMGYLVNGPVGTGKTFLVSCFASDIGVPMVMLKNFRSQWQGATEGNLERVLKLLKAMAPVAVMIDEADAYLGSRNAQGDSGVSSRVFSMLATFMSNTEHRGQIIWFLLTARPDLMPVDFKRQGRAEEHIALFYPETQEEKRELFAVMLRKTEIKELDIKDFDADFFDSMTILSGADMEAALTRAKFQAAAQAVPISVSIIQKAFTDFIPPTYPDEIELMNLVAVLECTSQELLPERYRNVPRHELTERVQEIKNRNKAFFS